MDCCVCSSAATVFRLPRNSICVSCFNGAKCMLAFKDNLDEENSKIVEDSYVTEKGLSKAFKWMKEMKEMETALNRKVEFLGGFVVALREAMHTDILVQPGSGGDPIPAHRALLAARSKVFKTVLASDDSKAPPDAIVSLPELDHDQLHCLLEFLYHGKITETDASKHVFALFHAANKYDIPFLKGFCENRMLGMLTPNNALEILEVSDACASEKLRSKAMRTVVEHAESVVFSKRYDKFALTNAHLCVEITRMLLRGMPDKRSILACETHTELLL